MAMALLQLGFICMWLVVLPACGQKLKLLDVLVVVVAVLVVVVGVLSLPAPAPSPTHTLFPTACGLRKSDGVGGVFIF